MNIGLIDVDGHNFPNLPLMKISAYHKAKGDNVEMAFKMEHYDIVYQSKVFDDTYSPDIQWQPNSDKIIKGGTGYNSNNLPDEIEHIYPDYDLYGIKNTAYGFLTRGCPRHCEFCIVGDKEGLTSHKVADLKEFWNCQKEIVLLDPNLLACKDRENLLQQLIDSKAKVDISQGFDARFLNDNIINLIKQIKIKMIHFAWDNIKDEDKIIPKLKRFVELTGLDHRRLIVYVLTNFNSTTEEDLYRIETLRSIGCNPYVMIYDRDKLPKKHITRKIQRWVNNRRIWETGITFDEYKG